MAYDKVTKLNTIAKRKAWSKVNQGKLVEYVDSYSAGARSVAEFKCPLTHAQLSVTVSKSGKVFRREATVGCGVSTSWPTNHGVRKARKAA
jgi:hypothetical protein